MKMTEKGFSLPEALLILIIGVVCATMVVNLACLYSNLPTYSSEEDMNELWNNVARKRIYQKEDPLVDIVY